MALESMRIVTGCKTAEEFVALFHRFCDAKTCFIPTADTRPVGSTLAFSLQLADGTPMLRGTGMVKAAWRDSANAYKRPGVQLEIRELAAESVARFEQMLAQREAVPEPVNSPGTQPLVFAMRPPAARSMTMLHPMTAHERFWYLCALGAVLLLAALVLGSAAISAS